MANEQFLLLAVEVLLLREPERPGSHQHLLLQKDPLLFPLKDLPQTAKAVLCL